MLSQRYIPKRRAVVLSRSASTAPPRRAGSDAEPESACCCCCCCCVRPDATLDDGRSDNAVPVAAAEAGRESALASEASIDDVTLAGSADAAGRNEMDAEVGRDLDRAVAEAEAVAAEEGSGDAVEAAAGEKGDGDEEEEVAVASSSSSSRSTRLSVDGWMMKRWAKMIGG
jgi:hypothetical protein